MPVEGEGTSFCDTVGLMSAQDSCKKLEARLTAMEWPDNVATNPIRLKEGIIHGEGK